MHSLIFFHGCTWKVLRFCKYKKCTTSAKVRTNPINNMERKLINGLFSPGKQYENDQGIEI